MFGGLTFEQFRANPDLVAGFAVIYKAEFGEELCTTCTSSLQAAYARYQQKFVTSNTKTTMKAPITKTQSKYRIKGNGMINVHNGRPYTNNNLTDAAVEDIVARFPVLASKFEMADGSPFELVSKSKPVKAKIELVKAETKPVQAETPAPEVNATDSAQKYATKHGIDLSIIKGTGVGGKITLNDVKNAG